MQQLVMSEKLVNEPYRGTEEDKDCLGRKGITL